MLKTYDSEQIAALDYAAYSKGDPQAGRRIQKEIAAGTGAARPRQARGGVFWRCGRVGELEGKATAQ